jgi:hypothetical protein
MPEFGFLSSYRRAVVVEVNSRVVQAVRARDGNQWAWLSGATSGDFDLSTRDEELGSSIVGGIVNANMFDSQEVFAIGDSCGQGKVVACETCC